MKLCGKPSNARWADRNMHAPPLQLLKNTQDLIQLSSEGFYFGTLFV
jgi:hypothetical protein